MASDRIDRLQDREGARVLHEPAAVPRRQVEVGDDGVQRVCGVQLTEETASQPLVGLPLVGEGFSVLPLEPHHLRRGRGSEAQTQGSNGQQVIG